MNKWFLGGIAASVAFVTFLVSKRLNSAPDLPDCSDEFTATKRGSTRDPNKLRLIVLHSTEGETAAGAAGWFANPASGGSAHYVVDDNRCFNTLPDNVIPWGAQGGRANEDGLHIEIAGYAKRTRSEWLEHLPELRNAAAIVRMWVDRYGIPLEFLSIDDLKSQGTNARGITTHNNISKAFNIVGGHTDPGAGFPIDVFFDLVKGKNVSDNVS
jgi:hypothetical protein